MPSHLDDLSRDAYEEITAPGRGNQYIPWSELVDLFEAHFQEKINLNNALLMLHAMKFDHNKDNFSTFSTKFFDLVAKIYSQFNAAALDVVASTELRDKIPQAWLNKLNDAHDENPARLAFLYDCEICQHLQNTEHVWAESQKLNNELCMDRKDNSKVDQKKNFKGQAVFSAETNAPSNEQFARKCGNGQTKAKGRTPSAFQG